MRMTRFTRYQRSLQIWTLLVCAARERKSLTYGDVARALGMKGAGVMSSFLDPIMRYCARNGYPPLTVLVVNQKTGLPGGGLSTLEEANADRGAGLPFRLVRHSATRIGRFQGRHGRQPLASDREPSSVSPCVTPTPIGP